MRLFHFLKKKQKPQLSSSLLGSVLLKETGTIPIDTIVAELQDKWKLDVTVHDREECSPILIIDGYLIVIAVFPYIIPGNEVQIAAYYNYLWPEALSELDSYKGHILLLLMNQKSDPVKENLLYAKIAAAILNATVSIGIYIGSRSLLVRKDFYLKNLGDATTPDLPLLNLIYFGKRTENGTNSMYTLGFRDFGKEELEIINSTSSLDVLSGILYGLSNSILVYNLHLKEETTIAINRIQTVNIALSDGVYIMGKTLKVSF